MQKPTVTPEWLLQEVAEYDLEMNPPPATVLDLGANVGAYSLRVAAKWPDAQIYAFEPHPDNFRVLSALNLPRLVVQRRAVLETGGLRDLRVGDSPVTHSFHDLKRQTDRVVAVECVAANDLMAAELIKIDTEGCEVEILRSLPLDRARALVVEYHRPEDAPVLRQLVEKAGLKQFMHIRHGTHGVLKFGRPDAGVSVIPKCFLAVPVYGGLDSSFAKCLMQVLLAPPCPIVHEDLTGDSLVSRARNTLTANFLQTDCTHLLFVDSDLIFSGEQVARIMGHKEDVVGGFYPKKQEGPIQWVCNAFPDNPPPREDGLQPVRYMGTGFLRVARRVFERMIEAYGEQIRFTADGSGRLEHDFWSVGVHRFPDGTQRHLSEDWFFCQRWLDLGGTVWADTRIILKHVGHAVYPLKSQEGELSQ